MPSAGPTEFQTRWLQKHCPGIWVLLNSRARHRLPPGLATYMSSPGALAGRARLKAVSAAAEQLMLRTGRKEVIRAYRRDLSGIGTEDALRDLLCELTLTADLALVTDQIVLRPAVGTKQCDLRARFGEHEFWGEVKRYEDQWFMRGRQVGRALTMRGFQYTNRVARIPRSEELRQKLNGTNSNCGVPAQLPDDAMGVLFLFHSGGFGRDADWITAALFGDAYGLGGLVDAKFGLEQRSNGLFLLQRWQRIAACCWVRASHETGRTQLLRVWHNPLALRPLPAALIGVVEALGSSSVCASRRADNCGDSRQG